MECIWKESGGNGMVDVRFSLNDGKENKEVPQVRDVIQMFIARKFFWTSINNFID